MKFRGVVALGVSLCASMWVTAVASPVYVEKVDMPMQATMTEVKNVLHDGGYKIVLHLNILKLIQSQQKQLKIPDFNARKFTDVQALVFCNPYDFSKLLNADWPAAAGCPLTLDVFSKGPNSYIVYGLRADFANTPASKKITQSFDQAVIKVLQGIPMSRQISKIPDLSGK